jgi:hypothetical protein
MIPNGQNSINPSIILRRNYQTALKTPAVKAGVFNFVVTGIGQSNKTEFK